MALIKKGVGDFFGLDIGTNGVRVVQLASAGPGKWSLQHYGYAPVDIKIATADSPEARRKLGEIIMTTVGQSGIKTKNVAINLLATKTFVTVVDLPPATEAELKNTIKYQSDEFIPMAIDEAKVDWAALGKSLHDPTQQEVLLASTAITYAEDRLELVEALGFDVIAAEPDSLAMLRSVATPNRNDAQVVVDIGEQSINVAVVYGGAPRLVRTIPNGLETLIRAVSQNLGVQEDQARQFVLKFGLSQDKLEGKVAHAIEGALDGYVSEVAKTIKFFQTRYVSLPVGEISLVGYASTIPALNEYFANKTGIKTSTANPWQFVAVPAKDQNLAAVASEFAVAIGLAQRGGLI